MSTPNVMADTLAVAAEEDLKVRLLPPWYDVDDYLSLRRLFVELTAAPGLIAPYTFDHLIQPSFLGLFDQTDPSINSG